MMNFLVILVKLGMSMFDKSQRLAKIFSGLSLLASVPLFLSLGKMPSPQVDSPSAAWDQPSSTISSESGQWHQQLTRQGLVAADSPMTKIPYPKPPSQPLQKHPVVSPQDLAKAKKTRQKKSPAAQHYSAPKVEIRVAIANGVNTLAVGVSTSADIRDGSGRLLRKLPANQGFYAQPKGGALVLGSWQLPQVISISPTQGGYVYIGDHWYRGRIYLASQGSTLLAVNDVELEKYLYSVVGCEMSSSSPIEALKAQAIAARSYAVVHLVRPATAWYNLGNTQRWQVYRGLDAEFNTTQQAVNETAGVVLSAQGGVFESLYAASDEIVAKAHGGVGMSQQGAYKLAMQGYNHQQILGVYYPGTSLARLAPQARTK